MAPVRLAELQATMDNDGRAPGVGGNGIGATCVGAPPIQIARGERRVGIVGKGVRVSVPPGRG